VGRGKASSFRPPLEKLTGEVGAHRERRRDRLLREIDQVGHVFAAPAISPASLEQIVGGMEQGIGTRDVIAEVIHLAADIERSSRW
jgi:hypothetical protein